MQKLHLVGFTTDHKSLILSARRGSRSGGFVLAVDEAVAAAVLEAAEAAEAAGDERATEEALPAAPPKPQSALSVKELQARLRAGRTIASVAAEAGVDTEWVTRFAMPVLAEQARVIDATRKATFSRARLGPSAMPVGASVYRNLVAKGIRTSVDELDEGWSTRQAADGRWMVTFSYASRGRRQSAVWELDLRRREVKALDRLAGELAFVPGASKVSVPAPSKPVKAADQPTDIDRANARRVAAARKQAAAQLAEAARQGSKRSVEAAKRAGSAKPKKRKPVPPVEAPPVEAQPAMARPVVAGDAPRAVKARPERTAPEPPPARADDPAVEAVVAVRQAAEALLSDFASGTMVEELPAPSPLPRPRPVERPPAVDTRSVTAARPVVEARPAAPAPAPARPRPPASAPQPSRALTRAVSSPEELRGRADDPRRGLRFRDDLAAPAGRNGEGPDQPAGPAGDGHRDPAATPRRRRTEPLRAR